MSVEAETNAVAPFASFEELRARNEALLASAETDDHSLGSISDEAIVEFLKGAAATGAVISRVRDRRAAQAIINFWAAELITRGKIGAAWSAPRLAAARADSADSPESTPQPSPSDDADLARSRALVRISASARQWRASGDAGWLLTGDALSDAEQFIEDDDDIRALVVASHAAERQATRRQRVSLGSIAIVLAALCIGLIFLLQKSWESESAATAALDAANQQSSATIDLNQRLQNGLARQAQRSRDQQQELDHLQDALKTIAPLIKRDRDEGRIADENIPAVLRPILDALDKKEEPAAAALPGDQALVQGYNPNFLQPPGSGVTSSQDGAIAIPLPKLVGATLANAYDNGQPIKYVNFSIVLNKARRSPIFTAVNLQRSAVIPLLRANVQYRVDPRVPPDAQMRPQEFASPQIDYGQLVNAREIAWGSAFGTDAAEAGRRAYAMVNLMPNVTPQFDTFNRGLWAAVERYARDTFSAQSDRVMIFSGPVLADDDPTVDGVRTPQLFWKVLVATQPGNAASLVVEAYLVAQLGNDGAKIPLGTKFEPKLSRVRVIDIERLAGLDFGETVRAADNGWRTATIQNVTQSSTPGDALTALLPRVTGPDQAAARKATQDLLVEMRKPQLADEDWRRLAEGLVALASIESFKSLGTQARSDVLALLAGVPKERWDADRWIDLKAAARHAVADAIQVLGACPKAGADCEQVAVLKKKLDWDLANGRTVYFQFAGMLRDDANAIAERLKTLGWDVPGLERTAKAAGYNEVRYGDAEDDRRAAELLAADLRALGRSGIRAKKVKGIKSKTPEIWISI